MADPVTITSVNQKIVSSVGSINLMKVLGWIFAIILLVAAGYYVYIIWYNKKIFKRKVTAFDIVGKNFEPVIRDLAKPVKIGTGGYEVLYLKKAKIYKIAYGGRVGRDTYYFFIMPDGYWYNSVLSAELQYIDKHGGMIPVVTTNPNIRGQYTSLEKQIDILHSNKQSIWEKYGGWIMGMGFVLISGVMLWLSYKEYSQSMSTFAGIVDKLGQLIDKINTLQGGSANNPTGLIQVK